MKHLFSLLIIALAILITSCANKQMSQNQGTMPWRGVVYDVGLKYGPGETFSVDTFNKKQIEYDLAMIADSLHCNVVRIEGESIEKLEYAAEVAHSHGMRVFFNPWKMNSTEDEVVTYMGEAAKAAERLRQKGVDIVMVTGCEYTLFDEGIFPGTSVNERMQQLVTLGTNPDPMKFLTETGEALNVILKRIVSAVRENYRGLLTYSSGSWELVDWSMFDIIGVDYYRDKQTEEEYVDGMKRYLEIGKPVFVMEFGCCAYEGAAEKGSGGFTVLTGADENGEPVYAGGKPTRNEDVQAEYIETQINLLKDTGVSGMFVFVYSFPVYPYREEGFDADMTSFALVKTFAPEDPRSKLMPPYAPKSAFHKVAEIYGKIKDEEQ